MSGELPLRHHPQGAVSELQGTWRSFMNMLKFSPRVHRSIVANCRLISQRKPRKPAEGRSLYWSGLHQSTALKFFKKPMRLKIPCDYFRSIELNTPVYVSNCNGFPGFPKLNSLQLIVYCACYLQSRIPFRLMRQLSRAPIKLIFLMDPFKMRCIY